MNSVRGGSKRLLREVITPGSNQIEAPLCHQLEGGSLPIFNRDVGILTCQEMKSANKWPTFHCHSRR